MAVDDDLLRALSSPSAYAHAPDAVSVLQTHISVLFFAGDLVYKVKKPIDLGFVDYSTLKRRRHFCKEEVRLNRRLAPETYLGVATIVRDDAGEIRVIPANEPTTQEALDYAVEMKRLPERFMLPERIERNEVTIDDVRRLATLLAEFHGRCPTGEDVNEHAKPESLRQQAEENLAQLRTFADESSHAAMPDHAVRLPDAAISAVNEWCVRYLDTSRALIEDRIARGRVRDGHGDLHAGNICFLPDSIVIYDCIEFTPRFRCRDVAGELAFLVMDLEYRGHGELGTELIEKYIGVTGDAEIHELLPFFKVHFAIVRSKVAAIRSREDEIGRADRAAAAREAIRYLALAVGYIARPALILLCGLPASGKSHHASLLSRALNWPVLRSDVIRKDLAGIQPREPGRAAGKDIYTSDFSDRTYVAMRDAARTYLGKGESVILDATFGSRKRRASFLSLGKDMDSPVVVHWLDCPESVIRERMAMRAGDKAEVSDADWSVYLKLRDSFEPPMEFDISNRIRITPDLSDEAIISGTLRSLGSQVMAAGLSREDSVMPPQNARG